MKDAPLKAEEFLKKRFRELREKAGIKNPAASSGVLPIQNCRFRIEPVDSPHEAFCTCGPVVSRKFRSFFR
ncbi:MAG: hypothetical protein LV479_07535, partial [Methylacidiphilales bacterium]|nr:hypothetical protein [Candidatus Methylacidiphilales bacterium]